MEQNQDTSLFGLNLDPTGKNHLAEAAKWAKFLAVVGFIMCALIVLLGIFAGSLLTSFSSRYSRYDEPEINTGGLGVVMAVVYVLMALLYFFPCLFLFHFASKMKAALLSNDQNTLNSSFQNLKKTFRYVGILTIIGLSLFVLSMIVQLAAVR
jgi:hypothetical protein